MKQINDNRPITQVIKDLAIPENKGEEYFLGYKNEHDLAPEDAEELQSWISVEGNDKEKTVNGVEFRISVIPVEEQ